MSSESSSSAVLHEFVAELKRNFEIFLNTVDVTKKTLKITE